KTGKATLLVVAVEFIQNKILRLNFGNEIVVDVNVQLLDSSIIFEVTKIKGRIESLNFLNIPLDLEGLPSDQFASCALALNLFTRVHQLPALQTHLCAECYSKLGIVGSKVAFFGVPQNTVLPVIRNIMLAAKDVPS